MGSNLHQLRRRDMKTFILVVAVFALVCSAAPALEGEGKTQSLDKQKSCSDGSCTARNVKWEKQCNGEDWPVMEYDYPSACPSHLYRCPCGSCIPKSRCSAMLFRFGNINWRQQRQNGRKWIWSMVILIKNFHSYINSYSYLNKKNES